MSVIFKTYENLKVGITPTIDTPAERSARIQVIASLEKRDTAYEVRLPFKSDELPACPCSTELCINTL